MSRTSDHIITEADRLGMSVGAYLRYTAERNRREAELDEAYRKDHRSCPCGWDGFYVHTCPNCGGAL